ncbi:MAG: glycosyltransferase family 39 protein [Anaerolineae bacterium]|nr:glycosyltransferase family 39 protein [Anaerolineae bacterium]
MSRLAQIGLIILLIVAFALRLPGVFANTFSADEALFASWARLIAVWRDPLLQTQGVDKPPLLFYTQAIFYPLLGNVTWAARLPDLIASLLLIPLTAQWAQRLYRDTSVALVAAGLVAISPLAIQFSATAFTDPLLTALLVAALLAVGGRRAFFAGLFFGLATATKYQAWLFLPLIAGLGVLQGWQWAAWRRWLIGLLPVVALVMLWSGGVLFGRQWQSYGGIRPIFSWELLPRLNDWIAVAVHSEWLFVCLGAILLLFLGSQWQRPRPGAAIDWLLAAFVVGYLALHWLVAIPTWQRYLLPLVPIAAVLVSRALVWAVGWVQMRFGRTIAVAAGSAVLVMALIAVWPVIRADASERHSADNGAGQIATYLADAPYGTVLYDHWASWQWRYYFFDTGVYVNWVPHAGQLVTDLDAFYDDQRYIVLPDSAEAIPFQRTLHDAGYDLQSVLTATGMTLYKIEQ